VGARRDPGHDAATLVEIDLAALEVRAHGVAILDHGDSRLIARRLDAEDSLPRNRAVRMSSTHTIRAPSLMPVADPDESGG
jgi:hypothetical protein